MWKYMSESHETYVGHALANFLRSNIDWCPCELRLLCKTQLRASNGLHQSDVTLSGASLTTRFFHTPFFHNPRAAMEKEGQKGWMSMMQLSEAYVHDAIFAAQSEAYVHD